MDEEIFDFITTSIKAEIKKFAEEVKKDAEWDTYCVDKALKDRGI